MCSPMVKQKEKKGQYFTIAYTLHAEALAPPPHSLFLHYLAINSKNIVVGGSKMIGKNSEVMVTFSRLMLCAGERKCGLGVGRGILLSYVHVANFPAHS